MIFNSIVRENFELMNFKNMHKLIPIPQSMYLFVNYLLRHSENNRGISRNTQKAF